MVSPELGPGGLLLASALPSCFTTALRRLWGRDAMRRDKTAAMDF